MTKPTYKYPDFVSNVDLKSEDGKRYWLTLRIDPNKSDGITVILKNPSRADKTISDKTVYNVSNFIYRNREKYPEFRNVGEITILNLIPNYLTDSSELKKFKDSVVNKANIQTIDVWAKKNKNVIIAWGDHPQGLFYEYEELKKSTLNILKENKNNVFYVNRYTNAGNPTHGQVWGYENELKKAKDSNYQNIN